MMDQEDPIRWKERGAPELGLALLAELDGPPPLPPMVRRRVRKAVMAEVRPGPAIPWRPLLAAAAIALLAFAAGWIGARETPAPEPLASPIAPERNAVEEEPIEGADPSPLEATEESDLPAGPEASPPESLQRATERRQRRAPMETSPDLLDPFAGQRAAMSATRAAPDRSPMDSGRGHEVLDPFAGRRSPMRTMSAERSPMDSDREEVLDPFASRGGDTSAHDAPTGKLVINTIPWARVFIDGRDTGQNTPVRNIRLPAGTHRIGLRTVDGTMHMVTVEVRAGEVMRLMRRL